MFDHVEIIGKSLCISCKVRLLYENRFIGSIAEFRLEDFGFQFLKKFTILSDKNFLIQVNKIS